MCWHWSVIRHHQQQHRQNYHIRFSAIVTRFLLLVMSVSSLSSLKSFAAFVGSATHSTTRGKQGFGESSLKSRVATTRSRHLHMGVTSRSLLVPRTWSLSARSASRSRRTVSSSLFSTSANQQVPSRTSDTTTLGVIATADDDTPKENVAAEEDRLYRELEFVSSELIRHDRLYYEVGEPEVSDEEYDSLCRRELEICETHPDLMQKWIKSGGSTRESRVGSIINDDDSAPAPSAEEDVGMNLTKKKVHLKPMLSLDNVHTNDDLLKWLDRIRKKLASGEHVRMLTEPKLDGLSISLRYNRGFLQWAATRGDGSRGQDVTAAVSEYIPGLPKVLHAFDSEMPRRTINWKDRLEIRGEVVLPKPVFDKLRQESSVKLSNARNAAAGMLLRKQPANSSSSTNRSSVELQFYAYDIVWEESTHPFPQEVNGLDVRMLLETFGFRVPMPSVITELRNDDREWNETDIHPMLTYASSLQKHRQGEPISTSNPDETYVWDDYEMDGCVHKVVEPSTRQVLGTTSRAPRWAIAHKLPPTLAITRLLNVTIQVGRTGALTPVAELEPVSLDGVVVQRATLHNFQHLQQLLGNKERIRRNAMVWIRRSGDVIPQVVSLVDNSEDERKIRNDAALEGDCFISLRTPSRCPACGSDTVFESIQSSNKSTGTGQVVRCGGPALLCPPRATLAIQHTFSRDALDITGLSEARIRQLMDADFIKVPSDLFELVNNESKLEELTDLEGWGPLSVKNLKTISERVAKNGVPLARFLYALNIRSVGVQTAVQLAEAFGSVSSFWREVDYVKTIADESLAFPTLREESESTKGIGPVLIASLISFAKDDQLTLAGKALSRMVRVIDHPPSLDLNNTTSDRPWHGKSVVFTGSIPGMSRNEAQKLAKQVLGAKSTLGTISKSTDWVIIGDKSGKKKSQADQLGVQTIDASEFIDLIENWR